MRVFAFIEAEKADFPISFMCHHLQVSKSGFYAWRTRSPSDRAVDGAVLTAHITAIHERSRQTYGAPRVQAELSAKHALRALGRRWLALNTEVREHDQVLDELTAQVSPTLRDGFGIGPDHDATGERVEHNRDVEPAVPAALPVDAGTGHASQSFANAGSERTRSGSSAVSSRRCDARRSPWSADGTACARSRCGKARRSLGGDRHGGGDAVRCCASIERRVLRPHRTS